MIRGIDAILYRNTGTYASPTFQEVRNVKDVQISDTKESYEASTRHERGVKVYEQTMSEIEITGMIRQPGLAATTGDPNFDDYAAFRDAYFANTVLLIEALTGGRTVTGSIGLNGFFKVAEWNEDQSNGVSLFNAFKLKPAPVDTTTLATTAAAEAMRRVKVAAGSATYANFGTTSYS